VGTPVPGKAPADLEAAIDEEIDKVKAGPIADWEIEKARTAARSNYVATLASSLQRAIRLSEYTVAFNKPDLINTRAESIARVTAADVQRVASQYLVKTGRTVVVTIPKPAAPKGGL
jgi:predicted Zn-dependent peptidase